jgi:hypothetical protein
LAEEPEPGVVQEEAIAEATLRVVVRSNCQRLPCVVGLAGRGAPEKLLKGLAALGRVSAATADDYVIDEGAVRAFGKRRALLVDVSRVKRLGKVKATAHVAVLATGLNSQHCDYQLRLSADEWVVDEKLTKCSIS